MKALYPALACSLAFGLFACSDDSSSSDSTTTDTSATTNVSTTNVALASTADATVPTSLYTSWLGYHFSTYETETTNFPELAEDWDDQYIYYYNLGTPAGRVVWSSQSTSKCAISEASGTDLGAFAKRGCTVSEGIGYGMLVAAFQEDWDTFYRLYIYDKAQYESLNFPSTGLMAWETVSFTYDFVSSASATDADLDIAAALIIAYFKTGTSEYLEFAQTIANAIWNYEINQSTFLIYSGDDAATWQTDNPAYNLSYFSPVAIRLFAAVDASHDWQSVLDQSYAYMIAVQELGSGVFPNWSDATGTPIDPDNGSSTTSDPYYVFSKEAVRIPWRIAWDYYWYGDSRALQVLTTLNNFIVEKSGGDPSSIPTVSYSWYVDNESYPDVTTSSVAKQYFAAWCATGIGTNSSWLDACTSTLNSNYSMSNTASSYFTDILHMMYSQLLNGKYVRPF